MLRKTLAGRHILLTGATGFVGKVWLAMVLERLPEIGKITLIVRPRSRRENARMRYEKVIDTSPVFRQLRKDHGANLGRFLGARLEVLDGDIEKPLLGIGTDAVFSLAGRVDAIIHCAGITDFQPDPLRALKVNVFGARHAAQLSRRLSVPLIHVSTCFVAGMVSGDVPEALVPGIAPNGQPFDVNAEIRALQQACKEGDAVEKVGTRIDIGSARAKALGWPNIYTYTKGLAEHIITQTKDVNWTIARPAIVECAHEYPFVGWNEGLNTAGPLAWLITTSFRRLPTAPDNVFDVIPVDEVAKGLTHITAAAIRNEAGGVYQLASSDVNPLTFGRCVELTGLGMRRWIRKGGGTPSERMWSQHLDPGPVAQHQQGLCSVDRLLDFTAGLRDGLGSVKSDKSLPAKVADSGVGAALDDWLASARSKVYDSEQQLKRIENMLELFKPFIHDHNYILQTGRVRALCEDSMPGFEWNVAYIDWRHYWVNVEFPGLQKWSIPVIRGEKIPSDSPSSPRFELEDVHLQERVASK
ncbi:MAG: NAD-dependent epimerase/dehydratase family protein [Rhodobacterales bacterium]|nr:NAD-dependent epimerase/dehydratase family protein [Rhodobacterales bacterium]